MGLSRKLKSLFTDMEVDENSLIVFHECASLTPLEKVQLLKTSQDYVSKGTLGVLSDCDFNSEVAFKSALKDVSNQERLVLASGQLLQLLTLKSECQYATHPSLMFGSVGKYSRFFARHTDLDFPYGQTSIFKDMYDLNALIIFDDNPKLPFYELKFAHSLLEDTIIKRNTTLFDTLEESFLDYDVALVNPFGIESLEMLFKPIVFSDTKQLYAVKYQELIDAYYQHLKSM